MADNQTATLPNGTVVPATRTGRFTHLIFREHTERSVMYERRVCEAELKLSKPKGETDEQVAAHEAYKAERAARLKELDRIGLHPSREQEPWRWCESLDAAVDGRDNLARQFNHYRWGIVEVTGEPVARVSKRTPKATTRPPVAAPTGGVAAEAASPPATPPGPPVAAPSRPGGGILPPPRAAAATAPTSGAAAVVWGALDGGKRLTVTALVEATGRNEKTIRAVLRYGKHAACFAEVVEGGEKVWQQA